MRLWQQRSSNETTLPSPVRHTSTGLPQICRPLGSLAANSLERPATNHAFSMKVFSGIAGSFLGVQTLGEASAKIQRRGREVLLKRELSGGWSSGGRSAGR